MSASPNTTGVTEPTAEQRTAGRRALRAAVAGFFVDMYDVYLPVIVLAPAIAYFSSTSMSTVAQATLTYAIFAASLIGRPLGALIFGPMGDRIGRRRTTIIVAAGFTICTGLIAVLPGYATIGALAPALLVLLRLLDGVFLGGEYTAANPLAMEYAPTARRGLYGSLLNIGYPTALAVITVVTMVTLRLFPAGAADSPYAMWGWRIPFVIGFVFSGLLFLYYVRAVPESRLWASQGGTSRPLRTLFAGSNLRHLARAAVVGTGAWLTLNAVVGVFSSHFTGLGASAGAVNWAILTGAVCSIAAFPCVGMLGQRFGRRRLFVVLGGVNVVAGPAVLALAIAYGPGSPALLVLLGAAAFLCTTPVWAVITAFLTELFPTSVRASGYGIAYSLPSIVPAFYSWYMLGLGTVVPYEYTPVVLLAIGGLFLIGGALLTADRRHVDLSEA
ncbi:MAG: MFS transporter [Streptosporangiales bacterium]|nr:MFS transporter [Streptosporangiales bacterium]